jgi:tRNA (guanosine-2'-O-)-methyltransferase
MSGFPFSPELEIEKEFWVNHQLVIEKIGPQLTQERRRKIDQVVEQRSFDLAVVLEGIYDRGNISAVMRTAEALGFVNFHVIETQEKFKEANRVTQGSDKWVETKKWKSTVGCVQYLKDQGFQICVTSLEGGRPISQVDFTKPTAFVLGNEKDGASKEMLAAADHRVFIPMQGFVQSFNISVAGAIGLYHILQSRLQSRGAVSELTEVQKNILKAVYYLRTQDSAKSQLKELFTRGTLG